MALQRRGEVGEEATKLLKVDILSAIDILGGPVVFVFGTIGDDAKTPLCTLVLGGYLPLTPNIIKLEELILFWVIGGVLAILGMHIHRGSLLEKSE